MHKIYGDEQWYSMREIKKSTFIRGFIIDIKAMQNSDWQAVTHD